MLRARSRQLNKPKKIPPTATGSASRAPQQLHRIERGVGGTPPPRGGKHPGGWRRSSASPRGGDTSSSRRGEGAVRRERREERGRRGRRKGGRAVAANRTAVWRLGCKPRARTPVGIVVRVLAWRPCGCAVGPAGDNHHSVRAREPRVRRRPQWARTPSVSDESYYPQVGRRRRRLDHLRLQRQLPVYVLPLQYVRTNRQVTTHKSVSP
ncbi:hypothetical protein DAI22_01g420200 [Oryza sativa Japonica Group]|nr:hypothetical protein DAI22_01g420200 [Oryza sativa Japonica Group]